MIAQELAFLKREKLIQKVRTLLCVRFYASSVEIIDILSANGGYRLQIFRFMFCLEHDLADGS